jgi:dTDP-4-amino-4,6-dideoxygalactose transaminase
MPMDLIPFNRPFLAGNEQEYLRQAVDSGRLSGDGSFTQRASALLESALGVKKVLLTTSCTQALDMSAMLLDLLPGDEVIVPAFTFVSTVNAFVLRGARPVFADICPDTLNLDADRLEGLITERTKAVVPVHYAGVGCEMEKILAAAKRHNLQVVEDNAHGLFGSYHGQMLGTFGALAAQSFHETKNFTCGEGGALLINDPALVERAEIIREKGTNRSRFFRGQVDKYTWVDIGSSYLPSELLAAYLLAQLEAREEIQRRRQVIWQRYDAELANWADARDVCRPVIPAGVEQTYHMYYLLFPGLAERTTFIQYMKERGIMCVFHYLPLHLSPMGERFGGKPGDCPVTEDISDRLVRLPFYTGITAEEQARVIAAIQEF